MAIIQHIPGALKARGSALVALVQNELWDPLAFACIVAWFCFQVVLERLLPGEVALGVPLLGAEGLRLPYKLNGHLAFWISLLLLVHGCPRFAVPVEDEGILPTILYDHFPQFAFAAVVFSFGLSLLLYLASFRKGARLADGGRSGNVMYDFYMGRELNPRLGSFDWKYFCELRPGLIGWVALNMGMLMKQQQLQAVTGEPPSWPLVLVNVFQGWYVLDALLNERAILTTMDITTDGFGFMLAFGDLAWVPFTYSLQARYLVGRPVSLSTYALAGLSAMHLVGYWIFRQANSTKDAFRRDPTSVPHVRYMDTIRGTKLMVSGWWGWARKINYTGDWLMALAWCGLCGPTHVLPYFYAIYFGILLVHRAARDDHLCSLKYGADWQKYKKEVKWLFLPGIY
ncbi:D14-sterol reductase [Nannochloropsis gaditana CCMP526]|uniref:D14-sterol reductase n=1 Tax=Nannochloropsis gaditana (strain CCMP526) TaxID=1093141 RepID=UPI00029F5CE4|nr:D14-sterol reductase [Nannochloropsis gaditana CCMP526]EKU21099.1 D14-sterol reductase [Nannochloropsis gaditana CCMP526]|eukprot:XP_005855274.1 D14-sterol reductase [Nannochloropsis gaditana CCMP526]